MLSLPPVAVLILSVLGIYSLFDASFSGVLSGQRVIYMAVISLCFLLVVANAGLVILSQPVFRLCLAWMLCLLLWLIPAANSHYLYLTYVVGDVVSIAVPMLFLFAGIVCPDLFRSRLSLFLLAAFLLFGMFVGMAFAAAGGLTRFEPPHNALLVMGWLMFFRGRGVARWSALFLLCVIMLLSFWSGARTTVVLWLLGFMYLVALYWPVRRIALIAGVFAVVAFFASDVVVRQAAETVASGTRFEANVEGEADESLMARFFEAQDAILQFGRQAKPVNYLFGFGHGATFRSIYAPMRNATQEGVVHNIHFGPVMIFYRYGLLGAVIYLTLIGAVIKSFFAQRKRLKVVAVNEMFFTFTLGIYLTDGLLRNVLVDPVFSYALAGFLFYRLYTRVGIASSVPVGRASRVRRLAFDAFPNGSGS